MQLQGRRVSKAQNIYRILDIGMIYSVYERGSILFKSRKLKEWTMKQYNKVEMYVGNYQLPTRQSLVVRFDNS